MAKQLVDYIPAGDLVFRLQLKPVIMSTPNHISLPDDGPFERRSKKRMVINRDALILFTEKMRFILAAFAISLTTERALG
jgi:hypothetical protein